MAPDEWLIRTAQNRVTGPFTRAQVIERVLGGELGLQDEVCAANDYWFYLHETEEVAKHLGVQVPLPRDDVERTDTATGSQALRETERTDTEVASNDAETFEIPVAEPVPVEEEPAAKPAAPVAVKPAEVPHPEVGIERATVWKSFVWMLFLAIGLVIAAVLRLIRQSA